ncbi:phosphotransferase [Terrabacter sp. BE26]|uniref:phosphotransferase n=1 Tax=Terrabacter sp. BE26 TaxID=2898152 RepID=UPI0035BE9C87
MTTSWPKAPPGCLWTDVDRLVGLVQPLVETEGRRGGVHQIRWEPERTTRVAFEAQSGDVRVCEATPTGVSRSSLREDAALRGAAAVLDPVQILPRLEHLLRRPVRGCTTVPVSYRPGSSCVIRCDVGVPTGRRSLFVKVLVGGCDEYAVSHRALSSRRSGTEALVPALVGCWPDLGAVVTAGVRGASASTLLSDVCSPLRDRLRLAVRLGRLLADIHRAVPGPGATVRARGVVGALDELTAYLPAAWHADPPTALSLGWTLDRLRDRLPVQDALVFGHGSFRAGQVVVDDERLTVLDLDGAGPADPARDLGNATAYLEWQRLRAGTTRAPDLVGALLQGYADAGGRADPDSVAWWQALALLKIAGRRYRSLDTAHWEAVPSLVATASEVLERRRRRTRSGSSRLSRWSPELTDSRAMTALLREQLRAGGLGMGRIVSAETLRLSPGRRVVVRYRVTGGSDRPVEVIAKAYAEPARAVVAHENLVLFDRVREPALRCGTQMPIGVSPPLGIVLCRSAPGLPVVPLPAGPRRAPPRILTPAQDAESPSSADVVVAAGHLGRWLRTVHTTGSGAGRRLDLGHEAANCAVWAERVGSADATLLAPARELAVLLQARATTLPVVLDALIHKDLHLAHVIVDEGGGATVIDLDEARMGDPAFDVAHLCTYAEEARSAPAELALQAFLDAYGDVGGPDPERRLAFFRAYSLLKFTRQALAGQAGDDVVRASRRRLAEGVAWLRE